MRVLEKPSSQRIASSQQQFCGWVAASTLAISQGAHSGGIHNVILIV